MEKMTVKVKRTDKIKAKYMETGMFTSELFDCGDQLKYEVEQDYAAMQEAIEKLSDYMEDKEYNYKLAMAHSVLLKRLTAFD